LLVRAEWSETILCGSTLQLMDATKGGQSRQCENAVERREPEGCRRNPVHLLHPLTMGMVRPGDHGSAAPRPRDAAAHFPGCRYLEEPDVRGSVAGLYLT
jgi:hypothetical protein